MAFPPPAVLDSYIGLPCGTLLSGTAFFCAAGGERGRRDRPPSPPGHPTCSSTWLERLAGQDRSKFHPLRSSRRRTPRRDATHACMVRDNYNYIRGRRLGRSPWCVMGRGSMDAHGVRDQRYYKKEKT